MPGVRVPQQERSRALVARILVAASELFATEGYATISTNRIAAKAGVSVGSLYQFFVDKHAVLDALQTEWAARLGAELDASLTVDQRPIVQIVDDVLAVHQRLDREQPGLLAVLLTTHAGSRQITSVRDTIQLRLEQIIEARVPDLPEPRRAVAAAMLIHLSLGLYTVPRSVDRDRAATRSEVRRALIGYLAALERA